MDFLQSVIKETYSQWIVIFCVLLFSPAHSVLFAFLLFALTMTAWIAICDRTVKCAQIAIYGEWVKW